MPRLGLSVSESFVERKAPPADKFGRRVRFVSGVERIEERKQLLDPVFLKVASGLALLAIIAMSIAMWRLFTFPH